MIGDIYKSNDGYYDGNFVVTKIHTKSKVDLWSMGQFKLYEVNIEEEYFTFDSFPKAKKDFRWKQMPSYSLKMIDNRFELIGWKLLNELILEQFCGLLTHLKIASNLDFQKGNPIALQINSGNEDIDLRIAMEILNILKDDVVLI